MPNLPSCWVHTGIGGLTELADVSGTGIEFIPKLTKCRVQVSIPYQTNTRTPWIVAEGIPVPGVRVSKPYRKNRT